VSEGVTLVKLSSFSFRWVMLVYQVGVLLTQNLVHEISRPGKLTRNGALSFQLNFYMVERVYLLFP
jgi:hypothetical protein